MEENLRLDPDALEGCGTEWTRTNSDSSAVTLDSSKDFSLHCAASLPQGQSTNWTNQKHSLYLSSLEASFVNELHRTIQLRGLYLQDNVREAYSSRKIPGNPCNLSEQFLVLQDGRSQKIGFERNELMLESTADSHVIAGSLLRHHSTTVERGCTVRVSDVCDDTLLFNEGIHPRGNSTFSCGTPRSSEQRRACHLRHLDLAGRNAEVIDQNFEDENQGAKSRCVPKLKK
ncbi:Cold regulated protein [Quillaja saponaria]|uniref:Cold regulated protein n=1 Tax=Quillaja saponaria TaxID=32244 RepID=A0AAD7KUL1_QUISA|nr:Cold regulated protein [Quillaja saponaria]